MRRSTRTSRPRTAPGLTAALVLLSLLFALSVCPAGAGQVTTEATAPVTGDGAGARREALASALARAVDTVVARHVPVAELRARAAELRSAFLARPGDWVRRYSIAAEFQEPGFVGVTADADVDHARILAELEKRGFSVRRLAAVPRVATVVLGEGPAGEVAQALRTVFEAQGFACTSLPGHGGPHPDSELAGRARGLGGHVLLGVGAEVDPVPGPVTATALVEGHRASVRAWGWIADARTGQKLDEAEARAEAWSLAPPDALQRASGAAGRLLAWALMARLEQSGWAPGGEVVTREVRVEELPDPLAAEEVYGGLTGLTEARRVELRWVGHREARWSFEATDAGVAWPAVLVAARMPRGRLIWMGSETGPGGTGVERLRWEPR